MVGSRSTMANNAIRFRSLRNMKSGNVRTTLARSRARRWNAAYAGHHAGYGEVLRPDAAMEIIIQPK